MKTQFAQLIAQQLDIFLPYQEQIITITTPCFKYQQQKVSAFITEIKVTITHLTTSQDLSQTEFYAEKLLLQFNVLREAVSNKQIHSVDLEKFKSSYAFPENIHALPADQKLKAYRNALRALNEKTSWLIEKIYQTTDIDKKNLLQTKMRETEQRKQTCLIAIEKLEDEIIKTGISRVG